MKNNPKISVIMLNYNGLRYLKRTIPPILALNYPNYEFIVVDNGSSDGSVEYLKLIKEIKLIQSPKLADKNFACNYAVKKSSGDYIFLCDNDLLIQDKDLLKGLLSCYLNSVKSGSISISFFNENEKTTKGYGAYFSYMYTRLNPRINISDLSNYHMAEVGYPHGLGFLIKKDIWLYLGGYSDLYNFSGDDDDIGLKLQLAGFKNYLYAKTSQVHIGISERADFEKYKMKFKKAMYASLMQSFIYFKFKNLLIAIPTISIFYFLKSIKQGIKRGSIVFVFIFFKAYYLFFRNLQIALKRRKFVQSNRIVKDDTFLNIKPFFK